MKKIAFIVLYSVFFSTYCFGDMNTTHVYDFSKWESYNSEKKAKKAARMVVMLNKGAMPPKKFRQSHSASVPTKEEISMISKWADSLKK